jgi:hypothetical protein
VNPMEWNHGVSFDRQLVAEPFGRMIHVGQ